MTLILPLAIDPTARAAAAATDAGVFVVLKGRVGRRLVIGGGGGGTEEARGEAFEKRFESR